jgi:TonB family protein
VSDSSNELFPNRPDVIAARHRLGDPQFVRPVPVSMPRPYPPDSVPTGKYSITVLFVVEADGLVSDVQIPTTSGVAALDKAVVTVVRTYRFKPATWRGASSVAVAQQSFTFVIQ